MGSLGIAHWLVLLIMLGGGAGLLSLLIWLIARSSRSAAPAIAAPRRSAADRLRELDAMKAEGLVSEPEWARRRAEILDSV
jgi:hypothetical protein